MIQWMQNQRKLLNSSYTLLHCLEVLFSASGSELQSIEKGQKTLCGVNWYFIWKKLILNQRNWMYMNEILFLFPENW